MCQLLPFQGKQYEQFQLYDISKTTNSLSLSLSLSLIDNPSGYIRICISTAEQLRYLQYMYVY
jgi:hypothetical protein